MDETFLAAKGTWKLDYYFALCQLDQFLYWCRRFDFLVAKIKYRREMSIHISVAVRWSANFQCFCCLYSSRGLIGAPLKQLVDFYPNAPPETDFNLLPIWWTCAKFDIARNMGCKPAYKPRPCRSPWNTGWCFARCWLRQTREASKMQSSLWTPPCWTARSVNVGINMLIFHKYADASELTTFIAPEATGLLRSRWYEHFAYGKADDKWLSGVMSFGAMQPSPDGSVVMLCLWTNLLYEFTIQSL